MRPIVALALVVILSACAEDAGGPTTVPDPEAGPSSPAQAPTVPTSSASTTATSTSVTSASTTTATSPVTTLPTLQSLAYTDVAAVDFPIMLTARPGDEVALLAERGGVVRAFTDGELGDVVLDISGRTTVDSERGLLGLARHPEDDGRLFAHYTDQKGDTVVSEFVFDGMAAETGSERVLLTVDQPASNHNGGMIQFGPDGALYLGLGDGGGAGDRFGNGQNPDTLLGGLVRIDVDGPEAELWHMGLRNPWRFWIDGDTIWIGDVGQSSYEEIDLASVAERGTNYGWPIMEGAHCFAAAECDTSGLHMPLLEIERGDGGSCSITGGVVYRGAAIPELTGRFLFSDYCGAFLRSVDAEGREEDHTDEVSTAGAVVSFGVDGSGEVYVLTTDTVLQLVAER